MLHDGVNPEPCSNTYGDRTRIGRFVVQQTNFDAYNGFFFVCLFAYQSTPRITRRTHEISYRYVGS